MDKPVTILINEFREKIVDDINNSGLPFWKIKDELQYVIMPQVHQCAMKEEKAELERYKQSIEDEDKDSE